MFVAMSAAVGLALVRGALHMVHRAWDALMIRAQLHVHAPGVASAHGTQKPEMEGMRSWHVGQG